MKAGDNSLTEQDREFLKQTVLDTFIKPSHEAYMRSMVTTANPLHLRRMYEGFQSIPKPNQEDVLQVRIWSHNGTFETPGFGTKCDEDSSKENKELMVSLDFPTDIDHQIGSGKLVLQLEVDTKKEGVKIQTIPRNMKRKLYTEKKTWADAEAHCQGESGHLASVSTEAEWKEVILLSMSNQDGVWLGGSDQKKTGEWSWSDESPWNLPHELEKWREGFNCILFIWKDLSKEKCEATYPFICQYDPLSTRENQILTWTYSKEQMFESFQVFYSYKASSQDLSIDNTRTTGFRLSWKIENMYPPLEFTTDDVGKNVHATFFEGNNVAAEFYESDRVFTTNLILPFDEKAGSGSLVIHIEVEKDTNEEDVKESDDKGMLNTYSTIASVAVPSTSDTLEDDSWKEELVYMEGSKYKLFKEKKTWNDAESHCQEEGGHLASVHLAEEKQEVSGLARDQTAVWLGGTDVDEEGVWLWSDGSLWEYTWWKSKFGSKGDKNNCLLMKEDYWEDSACMLPNPFICGLDLQNQTVNNNMTLKYVINDPTISMIKIKYLHKAAIQNHQEILKNKRKIGYRLSWFLERGNGENLTDHKENISVNWEPERALPRYQEQYLFKMVELASTARANNMTREEIINMTMKEKTKLITSESIEYTSMCSGGQVKKRYYPQLFNGLNIQVIGDSTQTGITDDDIETGFMMFSVIVFCSEPVALSLFLCNLLTTQSPRTIIQATVNTIQSGDIKEVANRKRINQLYLALDKIFNFQIGKILLATSSSSQLKSMIAKDWPYFSRFSKEIDQCLNNSSCQGVRGIIQDLGDILKNAYVQCEEKCPSTQAMLVGKLWKSRKFMESKEKK